MYFFCFTSTVQNPKDRKNSKKNKKKSRYEARVTRMWSSGSSKNQRDRKFQSIPPWLLLRCTPKMPVTIGILTFLVRNPYIWTFTFHSYWVSGSSNLLHAKNVGHFVTLEMEGVLQLTDLNHRCIAGDQNVCCTDLRWYNLVQVDTLRSQPDITYNETQLRNCRAM